MIIHDLTGVRFGILTVVRRLENNSYGSTMWQCLCDCGNVRKNAGASLRAGRAKSCGCASPRFTSKRVTTHGKSRTRTYRLWAGMHRRCKPDNKKAHLYFHKGIKVCDEWRQFERFLSDMGECPNGMTLERIDGSAGYQPQNCRWATPKEQANNTTRNLFVEHMGKRQTIAQWAEELGMKPNTLLYRFKRGWSSERALNITIKNLLKTTQKGWLLTDG